MMLPQPCGQLAKMGWGLGLRVRVPMCLFVPAHVRRHTQRYVVVAA
jgi:hypothetical protein